MMENTNENNYQRHYKKRSCLDCNLPASILVFTSVLSVRFLVIRIALNYMRKTANLQLLSTRPLYIFISKPN